MKISQFVKRLSPSPTLALNARAKQLQASGKNILNFSVGEPDFPTEESICEKAIEALRQGKTKYGPPGGGLKLREALAAKLKRENKLNYSAEQIVCGMGAKELLFHLFLAILDPEDEVIVQAPYWVSYVEQIRACGAKAVVIPAAKDPSQDPLNLSSLESYSSEKTVAYLLCSPNNPGGYVVSQSDLEKLARFLQEKNWWIVSDEVYEYLSYDKPHLSLLELLSSLQDRFIHVNSFSKSFAMTGWRVGYTAGPQSLMKELKKIQSHSSSCLPPFIEEAATFAAEQGKKLMKGKLELLAKRRDRVLEGLKSFPDGVRFVEPQGAFYLFLDLRELLAGSKDYAPHNSLAFCEMLLTDYHMAVVPGEAFGSPGFLRFSYATSDEMIDQGLDLLNQAIKNCLVAD